jgi:hypothetical protein
MANFVNFGGALVNLDQVAWIDLRHDGAVVISWGNGDDVTFGVFDEAAKKVAGAVRKWAKESAFPEYPAYYDDKF